MKKLFFLALLLVGFVLHTNGQSCTSILGQNQIKGAVKVGAYIWSATNGGLVKYDTATYQKTYYTKDNSDLPQNSLNEIAVDATGNLWITTFNSLVIKFDGTSFTTFDLAATFSSTDYLRDLGSIVTNGNNVYIPCGEKLFFYNGSSWSNVDISYTGEKTIMYVDDLHFYQNDLFISLTVYDNTETGSDIFVHFIKFNGTAFSLVKEIVSDFNGEPSDQITTKFELDSQGNFWIAMFEGALSKMDRTTLIITKYSIPSHVRNCPNIYITVMIFLNDNLYFGGAGKNGLLVLNINTITWSTINDSNSSMPRSDVMSIVFISSETIYIGNEIELVRVKVPTKACTIHNINSNQNKFDYWAAYSYNVIGDNIYFSGAPYFGGGDSIRVHNLENSSWYTWANYGGYGTKANKIVKDNNGKLWACSYYGIFYLEPSNNTWTQYTTGYVDTILNVSNMLFDKNNNIWLCSNQDLIKINPMGVIKKIFKMDSGAYDHICYDNNNYVYAASKENSSEGISKINIVTDAMTSYTVDNYGQSIEYVQLSYSNDTLYYCDFYTMGKLHNGQLTRKFELSDYVSSYTQRAPVKLMRSFCVDKARKIWFLDATLNSVFAYDENTGFETYDYTNSCLSNSLMNITCDERNRKWVKADGLYRIEDNTMSVTGIFDGVSNSSPADAFIYPNPLFSQAHVQLPEYSAAVRSIAVMDLKSSETITLHNFSLSGSEIELNLSFLKQGMYILRVTTEDDKERNLKFVKMP